MNSKILVGTHNGIFHLDDLVAVSLISAVYDLKNIDIIRTRDNEVLKKCDIVVDVGGGKYDHHYEGFNLKRLDGTMYASAGLIFKDYGEKLLTRINYEGNDRSKILSRFDEQVIKPVDKNDNGIKTATKFDYAYDFLNHDSELYLNSQFETLVDITVTVLINSLIKVIYDIDCEKKLARQIDAFDAILDDNNMLEIDSQTVEWRSLVIAHNMISNKKIDFVYFPYIDGGYAAQSVPLTVDDLFSQRIPFPYTWGGLKEKLAEVSGVSEATFCHKNLFFVRADTKYAVIKLCEIATKQYLA